MFFQKNKLIKRYNINFKAKGNFLLCFFILIISRNLYTQNNNFYPIKDAYFQWYMNTKVEPYIFKYREGSFFKGKNNLNIYYEKYINEANERAIVISHGFTEYIEKYHELIYYFLKNNYNVYIMEHRGQGRSARLGKDKRQVDVEDYNYYVEDFKKFLDEVVVVKEKETIYLYAHSMGGAIGALFLQRYPNYFEKAILSSPMFTIRFGRLPNFIASLFIKIKNTLTSGRSYAPTTDFEIDEYNFEDSSSSSKNRYSYYHLLLRTYNDIQLGGPSINWVNEMLKLTKEIRKKENIKKIETPILLFQAENDKLVRRRGQNKFAKHSPYVDLIFMKDSKHELYREEDTILGEYLNKIFYFLNN